jgi:iron complex outermembrane receptor protein
VTFKATDRLSLTLGGRYHDQDNGNWGEFPNNPQRPALPSTPGALPPGDPVAAGPRFDETTNSFSKDSYRAAVQYDISNDVMIYAGYSEGFNSGGVGRLTINDENGNPFEVKFPYDPESIRNMEAGIKADWLEGRLRTNVTVFFTEWDDIQLSGQVNNPFRPSEQLATLVTQNVAGAEAKGGEVSILFAPTPSFRLNADVGILRTEYTEVEPGSSVSLGDRFGLAPELQYSLGAQWNGDLAGGSLVTRIDYNWTDEYIRSYVPAFQRTTVDGSGFEEGSRGLLNARIAYSPEGSNWELAVSGTNLTDERYLNGGFFTTLMLFDNGRVGRPREAGISLKVQF